MIRRFLRQPHARAKGAVGEDRAVAWLRGRGYRVLARNVRNAGGELDVVAQDGDTLCFVEIKARTSPAFGGAVAAVDRTKRGKLVRAARAYLSREPWDGPCRFDVLAIDLAPEADEPRFTLLRNAFQAEE
jgi:putative endonuclease